MYDDVIGVVLVALCLMHSLRVLVSNRTAATFRYAEYRGSEAGQEWCLSESNSSSTVDNGVSLFSEEAPRSRCKVRASGAFA
jgi:hypothetical protein